MISLSAFRKFHLHDVGALLSWLGDIPCGQGKRVSLKGIPIQTGTLVSALAVLEELGFVEESSKQFIPYIEEDANRFIPTAAGRSFLRATPSAKRATLRKLLFRDEQVRRIVELLGTSTTGRLPRKLVNESFAIGTNGPVRDQDIFGFIACASACELFGYDRKGDEIFRIDPPSEGEGCRKVVRPGHAPLPKAS